MCRTCMFFPDKFSLDWDEEFTLSEAILKYCIKAEKSESIDVNKQNTFIGINSDDTLLNPKY